MAEGWQGHPVRAPVQHHRVSHPRGNLQQAGHLTAQICWQVFLYFSVLKKGGNSISPTEKTEDH